MILSWRLLLPRLALCFLVSRALSLQSLLCLVHSCMSYHSAVQVCLVGDAGVQPGDVDGAVHHRAVVGQGFIEDEGCCVCY